MPNPMMNDWMLTRAARLLEGVDMAREAGLEIGPLASPLLHKAPGRIVHYADYADRDTLIRESANNPTIDPALIPEIDHVIAPLPKSLDRTYDFIVAAHVAEHVPDLLGWITTLMGWLTPPHGRLILAIPDKRYCFDIQRPLSTVGQVLDAYYQRRERPTLGAVYDGFSTGVPASTPRAPGRKTPTAAPSHRSSPNCRPSPSPAPPTRPASTATATAGS